MTATMYYTLFIVIAVFNCQAQILPGGVPLFNGAFLGQPLNLQNSFKAVPQTVDVPISQKFFTRGIPVMPSLAHRVPVTALRLGPPPGLGMIPLNPIRADIPSLQLRSTDAKENREDQKVTNAEPAVEKKIGAILEEMKKEMQKPVQQPTERPADSIDPVDQETDDIPKEVIGSSGSFLDGSSSPVSPKTRSAENGEGIPDLDYLLKAANPIDDLEKKVETTAKKIGQEIKHAFKNLPKLFQSRAEARQNEEGTAPYNNDQSADSEIMNERQPVFSSGLKKAMDDFQKTLTKSQLMQKYYGNQKSDRYHSNQHSFDINSHDKEVDSAGKHYGNQKTDSYYSNQHSSDVYSQGKEVDSAGEVWESTASAAKNIAGSLIKEGQSKVKQTESGSSSGSRQENNPTTTFFNSATNTAGNIADAMQNYDNAAYKVPNYENGIPAYLWKAVSDYVDKHAKNFANPEQRENNEFLGTLHQYGYGHGGYPGYYGSGYHGHHGHHGHGSHYPYYPGSYQNGYYPRPGWQYGNGYYKRSPVEVENSTVSRNLRSLPIASESTGDVAETVFDLVRSIMDGSPHDIAHASINMGSEIVDATSDSDLYKRTVEKPENSTLARNARQMPQVMQSTQSGDITNSAILLAQSILARKPGQIANAGVNMGSGIAGAASEGQRFFKRSNSVGVEDSLSLRSPRQLLPILPIPGLMSPVRTGIASTALNFAQGFVGANPRHGVIQPIVGGFGTSAGNLAQGLGLIHNQPSPIQGVPVDQLGQIVSSAVNLAQGITQIAGAANHPGLQAPRFIRSDSTGVEIANNSQDQIVNSGINIDSDIATSSFFKRSDSTEPQNTTTTRILRQMPLFPQGWAQPASTVTNSALNLAQSILSGNPSQIANSGVNMGTGIAGTANEAVINRPRFFKRNHSLESQNATAIRNLRQIPTLPQGWLQPAGTVTNSALNLAQSILTGNPGEIANSGVSMGTGIAGTANGVVFNGPRFFKRSPQGSIWQSATGLAGSIASSANVDPSRIGTQDVLGTAVGATKKGGSASPSDLLWESISDLASNVVKVTEKPIPLGKALTLSNSPVKSIVKSPNLLTNGASTAPGEIANSATTLAGRIASILMNPNVFNNPNLDAADGKPINPLSTPVHMAGDIVGVALNPEAYRNARMLKSYAPTHTGDYVQMNVPSVPTSPQQQSTTT